MNLIPSGSTKNIIWTEEMDMCMTDELIVQKHKGNYLDYEAGCSELFVKCGARVSVKNVRNRLRKLRKDLSAFQYIQNYSSDFSFNRVTRMMDAKPEVWENLIDAHPKRKGYQHKSLPSFENLLRLFGNDRAAGKDAETIKGKCIRLEGEREESNSIATNQEGDKEMELDDEFDSVVSPSIHKKQDPNLMSTSSKIANKRKHVATSSKSEDFQMLKNRMDSVESAFSKCAPRVYITKELFEEVSKVEGLDEDAQLLAYDYLCGDEVREKAFTRLPISRRKRWLELKLGWSSHNPEIDSKRHL